MAKKTYRFSAFFVIAVIISTVFVLASIALIAYQGLNLSVDFKGGLISQVRFAPKAFGLNYVGPKTFTYNQDSRGVTLIGTALDSENEEHNFLF